MFTTQGSQAAHQSRTEVVVMPRTVESFAPRYAVIEAILSQGGRERFTIAYSNERSLRDVVAAVCILETGFLSREDATQACAEPVAVAV